MGEDRLSRIGGPGGALSIGRARARPPSLPPSSLEKLYFLLPTGMQKKRVGKSRFVTTQLPEESSKKEVFLVLLFRFPLLPGGKKVKGFVGLSGPTTAWRAHRGRQDK